MNYQQEPFNFRCEMIDNTAREPKKRKAPDLTRKVWTLSQARRLIAQLKTELERKQALLNASYNALTGERVKYTEMITKLTDDLRKEKESSTSLMVGHASEVRVLRQEKERLQEAISAIHTITGLA